MTGLWIGLGAVAVAVGWLAWELHRAPVMPETYEDAWGCEDCAQEARDAAEVAELESWWAAS